MMPPHEEDVGTLKDVVSLALEKSAGELNDAKDLYEKGVAQERPVSIDSAANRAYYSIFSAITAIHALDGNHFRKHKDAIGIFNKNYVHTGIFPKRFGHEIHDAEVKRHTSDYDMTRHIASEDVKQAIAFAEEFYRAVCSYCGEKGT
ncbi:HEPN domain-containing protein [uncultured Selenomonas sp.]|uniref:HEPN domain-containing protein n=1 Tax=uncultured Selenomonas sp. TaxID=159275 RepID=UPI0025E3E229|nr:HEPN domain-containing protein [uncultured Selenomonas sp.]